MSKSNDNKTSLTNSFLALLKSRPLTKITVIDIVEESNLSRQTFYRYFDNIDDLIYHIHINNVSLAHSLSYKLDFDDNISKIYLDLMLQNQSFYQKVINFDKDNSFINLFYLKTRENYFKILFNSNEDLLKEDDFLFSLDFYSYSVSLIILKWIKEKNSYSTDFLGHFLNDIMPDNLKNLLNK